MGNCYERVFGTSTVFLLALGTLYSASQPTGHLQPIGNHRRPEGNVEERHDLPSSHEFYKNYVTGNSGEGAPVILRSAAIHIPAFKLWSDDYLREKFGDIPVEVEPHKKENRKANAREMRFGEFLDIYKKEEVYLVHTLTEEMSADMSLLPVVGCGGFLNGLQDTIVWMSSGMTRSVLHYDSVDNLNCVLSGSKKLVIFPALLGEQSGVIDIEEGGYSGLDVQKVDLHKYPGMKDLPWWRAELQAGDCLYIPQYWLHHVDTPSGRSLAVNSWFAHLMWFNMSDCYVPLSQYSYASPSVEFRSRVLRMIPDLDAGVKLETFEETLAEYENELAHKLPQSAHKVFQKLDIDGDGLVKASEIYEIPADEFTQLFNENFHIQHDEI